MGKLRQITGTRAKRGVDVGHMSVSEYGVMGYGYACTSTGDQTTALHDLGDESFAAGD
jgi:hypothetical protein